MVGRLVSQLFLTAVITSKYDFLYLDEWVQFHQRIGFDHIYLIDTTVDNNIMDYINTFPDDITLMSWTENNGIDSSEIYNTFFQSFKNQPVWNAFVNLDEFIVLKKNKTVQDLISQVANDDGGAFGLETLLFGNNGQNIYSNKPVVKRFTKRSSTPHNIVKTIAYLPDIHYWANSSRPVLREGKKFHTVHGSDHAAVIHKYPIKSIQEFNWNQQQNMDNLMEYLTDIDCSRERVLRVFVPADGISSAVVGSSTPVCVSKLFSDVTDTSAWDQFKRTAVKPPIKPPVNFDAFNRLFTYNYSHEDVFSQQNANSSGVLMRIPVPIMYGMENAADFETIREFVLYRQPDISLQINIFCVDYLLRNLCIQFVIAVVTDLRTKYGIDVVRETVDYVNQIYDYLVESTREDTVNVMKNVFIFENHHDECHAVWREQQQQQSYPVGIVTNSIIIKSVTDNTASRTVMYVINHDDTSEKMIYDKLTANGTYVLNGNVRPVRIASSVFFESVFYRDVLPYRYREEWQNVDYVGISTYKTIYAYSALCSHVIERILLFSESKEYDVIPLLRSPSPLVCQAVYSHGRLFRKAWYLLLEELGYSRDVILKYEQIPGFYRNTMYIRPAWLVRLSQFI